MRIDFKGILEGAWNSMFVNSSIEEIHKERLEICKACPYNSSTMKKNNGYKTFRPDFHCAVCGCNLDMKTRCMSCECPEDKWGAEMSEEEEKQITDKLNKKDAG